MLGICELIIFYKLSFFNNELFFIFRLNHSLGKHNWNINFKKYIMLFYIKLHMPNSSENSLIIVM